MSEGVVTERDTRPQGSWEVFRFTLLLSDFTLCLHFLSCLVHNYTYSHLASLTTSLPTKSRFILKKKQRQIKYEFPYLGTDQQHSCSPARTNKLIK